MNSYRDIPLWENKRRIEVLEKFRNDVVSYFKNNRPPSNRDSAASQPGKEQDGQARQQINLKVSQVYWIINAARLDPSITDMPTAASHGPAFKINTILNLFDLDSDDRLRAVGFIDMALGVYQSDRKAARRRTINPFWWMGRGLLWIVKIPFVLLGAVGFDAGRVEGSFLGKIFKLLIAASALLTILNYLGWLSAAKALLGIE